MQKTTHTMSHTIRILTIAAVAAFASAAWAGPKVTGQLGGLKSSIDEGVSVQAIGKNLRTVFIGGLTYSKNAAHPTKTEAAFTIDMDSGKVLTLKDMFGKGSRKAVNAIAKHCDASLRRQLGKEYFTPGMAGKKAADFRNFEYSSRGLRVHLVDFPFVIGPQAVTVPWKKLPERQIRPYR